ncbi:MAG: hypothetical protein ABI878_15780, partial [Acidobacteriota bacterium]
DGKELTHCSTTKNEANVPLFIVGDPNHLPKSDTNFLASHSNIFATLLDLMDLPGESRPHSYALSLFKATRADSKPRYYFEGNLNSRFGNSRNLFDQ